MTKLYVPKSVPSTPAEIDSLENEISALCKHHGQAIRNVIGERLTFMMLLQVLAEDPEFKRIMVESDGIFIDLDKDGMPVIHLAPNSTLN